MPRPNFVRESLAGWGRLRPDADLFGLGTVQRLVWSGRLAEELLERTANASGLRRRGDYEVLSLLRRVEPALLSPLEVAQQLQTSQSGMTGKLDRLERQELIQRIPDSEDRRALRLGITHADPFGCALKSQPALGCQLEASGQKEERLPRLGDDLDLLAGRRPKETAVVVLELRNNNESRTSD